MARARIAEIIRNFPENGLKVLLENPENVRDLLVMAGSRVVDLIDFEHMKPTGTTFVQRDYRHVEADLVLTVPLLPAARRAGRRKVLVYILIEHQSEPDRLMPLRILEYVVEIYRIQVRTGSKGHASLAEFRLQPVLPVVFYTGERAWETPGTLTDIMDMAEFFAERTPRLEPLFLNVGMAEASRLEKGGYFGQVVRLLRNKRSPLADFQHVLHQVVEQLERMPENQRLRWLELLSYIHALVYHERGRDERSELQHLIEASVRSDKERQEVLAMGKTIWQDIEEKGMKKGAVQAIRKSLLRLLRKRFDRIPAKTEAAIAATDDLRQLEKWLDRVVEAATLDDVGIPSE